LQGRAKEGQLDEWERPASMNSIGGKTSVCKEEVERLAGGNAVSTEGPGLEVV